MSFGLFPYPTKSVRCKYTQRNKMVYKCIFYVELVTPCMMIAELQSGSVIQFQFIEFIVDKIDVIAIKKVLIDVYTGIGNSCKHFQNQIVIVFVLVALEWKFILLVY